MQAATTTTPSAAGLSPAAIVGLLASMYLFKPAADTLTNWRDTASRGVPENLAGLDDALGRVDVNSTQEMEDLLWDYTRLFVGPYRLPCPPWESVYTSEKRLLLQEASDAVQATYERLGLQVGTADVLPDHVGAELNFMGILLERIEAEPSAADSERRLSKEFLDQHLLNWVPRFTADMENAAETPLYRALARSTRAVLEMLCEDLRTDRIGDPTTNSPCAGAEEHMPAGLAR